MNKLRLYKKEWVLIVLLPLLIFLIDYEAARRGLYQSIDVFDEVMHFIGGIVMGIVYILFLKIAREKKQIGEMNLLMLYVFIVSLVALTAVGWELYEYGLDVLLPRDFLRQPSVRDTMGDLFLGLVGGTLGFLLVKKREVFYSSI